LFILPILLVSSSDEGLVVEPSDGTVVDSVTDDVEEVVVCVVVSPPLVTPLVEVVVLGTVVVEVVG
jgi:hypothetical protein